MKKLFLLLFLSLTLNVLAQYEHILPTEVYLSGNNTTDYFKETVTYNEKCLLKEVVAKGNVAGEFIDHIYTYWYDSKNRLIRRNSTGYSIGYDGDNNTYYTYQDDVLVLSYSTHESYDEPIEFRDITQYYYDSLGRRVKTIIYQCSGYLPDTTWVFQQKTDISYSEDGKTVYQALNIPTYYNNDSTFTISNYDDNSNLITYTSQRFIDDNFHSSYKITYEYDNNLCVNELRQTWSNESWQNSTLTNRDYNEDGNLSLYILKNWIDDEFVNDRKIEYFYDSAGLFKNSYCYDWNGDEWITGLFKDETIFPGNDYKELNKLLVRVNGAGEYSFLSSSVEWTKVYEMYESLLSSEWFYKIEDDEGNITYQHLECAADTTIDDKRAKVIVKSNTLYDKGPITETTKEYIWDENGIVYWWNKELQEFTTLYNFTAEVGDQWEIKVGNESLTMNVDAVETIEYEGKSFRKLVVSDANGIFSGGIICGIGHTMSFFPERLLKKQRNYRVEGMRCFWVEGELLIALSDDDCDAIYNEIHNHVINYNDLPDYAVYPNPADDFIIVSVNQPTQFTISDIFGKIILKGVISSDNQQIDVSELSCGMYFIKIEDKSIKIIKN